ncbi:hypothetical protein BKA93DRAFT_744658, partial [Sparassis latifolia]
IMHESGSIISGSAALWFIHRQAGWFLHDIDLYVAFSLYEFVINQLLVAFPHALVIIGRCFVGRYSTGPSICQVVQFITDRGRIDIVCSRTESPLFPISHFWSTLVMNFVSADTFGSAYPALTLRRCGLLSPYRPFGVKEMAVKVKYEAQSYEFGVRWNIWED